MSALWNKWELLMMLKLMNVSSVKEEGFYDEEGMLSC